MIKYKASLALFFILIISTGFSQVKKIRSTNGEFTLLQFAENVIKITYKPNGYTRDENVSDAVIEKPLKQFTTPVKLSGNVLKVGKEKMISFTSGKNAEGYNGFRFDLKKDEKIFKENMELD